MGLEITNEKTLLDIERENGDHFCIVRVKAKTEEGRVLVWYSIQTGKMIDGEFKAKSRTTIRSKEMQPLLETLQRAVYGYRIPPGAKFPEMPAEPEPPPEPEPEPKKTEHPF
jgi:hypothetical protein